MKLLGKLLRIVAVSILLVGSGSALAAKLYKPFVLASEVKGDFHAVVDQTEAALKQAGFQIVGVYSPDLSKFQPYQAATIFIVTNPTLLADAAKTPRGGYGAVMRVSVTQTNDQVQVAYVNPVYVQYAYRMKADLDPIKAELAKALGDKESFGAQGLSADKLLHYHYTFGMEYFDEPYHLNDFSSHDKAVSKVRELLKAGTHGIHFLYELNVPGTDQTVFGVSMDSREDRNVNDAYQMSVVDFRKLKGTAYLPYQILVKGRKVEALNMRFRMAVFFPDLSMMGDHSFMTLMSAPAALHRALAKAAGGSVSESLF
ncbi:hypothetical protein [Acidihalobacter prosperus]|uniref:Uncharacterized protein n=1 Tax=Acidihalobacter prosperus TaxID=160660 RepID=A0A1A6C2F8_9GAMM|nr:hypothetical protein [Acidihalobacter prosperus]OBS08734.1 hypothetical protein Thpro_022984 [Acidihalobacter prosperus]